MASIYEILVQVGENLRTRFSGFRPINGQPLPHNFWGKVYKIDSEGIKIPMARINTVKIRRDFRKGDALDFFD